MIMASVMKELSKVMQLCIIRTYVCLNSLFLCISKYIFSIFGPQVMLTFKLTFWSLYICYEIYVILIYINYSKLIFYLFFFYKFSQNNFCNNWQDFTQFRKTEPMHSHTNVYKWIKVALRKFITLIYRALHMQDYEHIFMKNILKT